MNPEGAFWKDPPGYFEQLVYPAYIDAHHSMFTVCTPSTSAIPEMCAHKVHRMAM
jgi:hypothetical protein